MSSNHARGHLLAGVVDAVPSVGDLGDVGPQLGVVALLPDVEDVGDAAVDQLDRLRGCDLVVEGQVTTDREEVGDEVGVGELEASEASWLMLLSGRPRMGRTGSTTLLLRET